MHCLRRAVSRYELKDGSFGTTDKYDRFAGLIELNDVQSVCPLAVILRPIFKQLITTLNICGYANNTFIQPIHQIPQNK